MDERAGKNSMVCKTSEAFRGAPVFEKETTTVGESVEALLDPSTEIPEDSALLALLANVLETVVDANEHAYLQDADPALVPSLTVFHGLRAPPISVEAYLVRIAKYAKCSPACFVQALALIFRLAKRDAAYQLTGLNVHRLVLTGVLLSAKFLDDHYYNNAFYAKVGGVSTAELNRLEVEMLQLLGFRLLVPREELEQLLADAQAGCLAAQVVARWRCGRKRRSMGLDDSAAQCEGGVRRGSMELVVPRRFGRVMA